MVFVYLSTMNYLCNLLTGNNIYYYAWTKPNIKFNYFFSFLKNKGEEVIANRWEENFFF